MHDLINAEGLPFGLSWEPSLHLSLWLVDEAIFCLRRLLRPC